MTRYGNLLAATMLSLLAAAAHADGDYLSPTNERMRISLGLMRVAAATTLQIDSSTGVAGTFIDGENDLGLDRTRYEPKFQVMVRAGERSRVRLDYFSLDRSDTKTLTGQPIVFRGVTLVPGPAGGPVQTDTSLRGFELTYGYSFLHSEKAEVAATLGLNAIDISARVRQFTPVHVDESETTAGPFPTPGLDATWVFSKRFYIDGRAQYFKVSVNHLSGSLALYELDILYRLRPNIAFAFGYNAVKAKLASTQATQAGEYNFDAKGPQLFVRVAF